VIVERCGHPEESEVGHFLELEVGATSSLEYGSILAREVGYLGEAVHIRTALDTLAERT
jgi:hypothetical protein